MILNDVKYIKTTFECHFEFISCAILLFRLVLRRKMTQIQKKVLTDFLRASNLFQKSCFSKAEVQNFVYYIQIPPTTSKESFKTQQKYVKILYGKVL